MREVSTTSHGLTLDELKALVKTGGHRQKFFSTSDFTLQVYRLDRLLYPFLTALLIRFFSYGACRIVDETGAAVSVSPLLLFRWGARWLADYFRSGAAVRQALRRLGEGGPETSPVRKKRGPRST